VGAWIFTGVLSFFGALAYAELGAMIPATGGQYVFLREAWGPLFGFLCGWTYFFVVLSASIAWLGITFSTYLSYFIPMSATVAKAVGVSVIVVMTLINYRGVRTGAAVQNTFTAIKLSALLILIVSAFLIGKPAAQSPAGPITMSGFGVAMISCVLTYDGWVALSFMAVRSRTPIATCRSVSLSDSPPRLPSTCSRCWHTRVCSASPRSSPPIVSPPPLPNGSSAPRAPSSSRSRA
jgi:amino acid transporter